MALGVLPILAIAHGAVVTSLRKPSKVTYPNCYATAEQAKSSKEAYKFNCAQRAHANYLENAPFTALSMLAAGLTYPLVTAGLGLGWVAGRVLYLRGYVYSEKENGRGRAQGSFFWLAQVALIGISMRTAYGLI